jgi:glycopeptide antibiotics resistance protein
MNIMLKWELLFIFLLPIWILARIVLFCVNKKHKRNFSVIREIGVNIFFIYILCLLSVTLFPLYIGLSRDNKYLPINLLPVMGKVEELSYIINSPIIKGYMVKFWARNIIGNILLMLPLTIMLPMLWEKFQSFKNTILFAFCLSLSIEIFQLLSIYIGNIGRATDIDDILLNVLGACIGFILYDKLIKSRIDKLKSVAI